MISYMNGNVSVTLLEDGTKIRTCDGLPMVRHPESLDVKITDHCTDVCAYCHEQSTPKGKHARIDELQHALQHLPTGVEIALGGGNPLTHPDLEPFLEWLTQRGLIPSITVNQKHLDDPMYFQTLSRLIDKSLVYGVGISIVKEDMTKVREIQKMTPHVVFHVIAGVNPIRSLETILSSVSDNVLVLGYKMKGRGVKHYSDDVKENLDEWYMHLSKFITKFGMSFDNLAIEQLNLKRFFTEEGWKMLYMGDDFTHSMYVDGVTQTYAPTSVSTERVSFKDMPLLEYFQKHHR